MACLDQLRVVALQFLQKLDQVEPGACHARHGRLDRRHGRHRHAGRSWCRCRRGCPGSGKWQASHRAQHGPHPWMERTPMFHCSRLPLRRERFYRRELSSAFHDSASRQGVGNAQNAPSGASLRQSYDKTWRGLSPVQEGTASRRGQQVHHAWPASWRCGHRWRQVSPAVAP